MEEESEFASFMVVVASASAHAQGGSASGSVAVDTMTLPNVVVLATGGTIAGAAKSNVTGRLHERPGRRRRAPRRRARGEEAGAD